MSELKTYSVQIDYYGTVSDIVDAESEGEAVEMVATDIPFDADGYDSWVSEV